MEWLGYTVGIIAHLWVALLIWGTIEFFKNVERQERILNRRIKIKLANGYIFVPFILVIGFWMWMILG